MTRMRYGLCWMNCCRCQQRRALTVSVTLTSSNPSLPIRVNAQDATALVDGLIQYTQQLISAKAQHVVAYSGGVDSSLVVALLQQASRQTQGATVHAVLGLSPAVSQEQVVQAQEVADVLQIPLTTVQTTEGSDDTYVQNTGQACFACKTHLYASLQAVVDHAGSLTDVNLYNGTNADDLQDSTRVGLVAARNFCVQSPLEYTTKQNVRKAARHLGLPNWNAAAAPCLRSRLALGVEATRHHLQMIECAERYIRRQLREFMNTTHNVRVRMLAKQRAMIEVDLDLLEKLQLSLDDQIYFSQLGFSSVDARPFRTGSVAKRRAGDVCTSQGDSYTSDAVNTTAAVG